MFQTNCDEFPRDFIRVIKEEEAVYIMIHDDDNHTYNSVILKNDKLNKLVDYLTNG